MGRVRGGTGRAGGAWSIVSDSNVDNDGLRVLMFWGNWLTFSHERLNKEANGILCHELLPLLWFHPVLRILAGPVQLRCNLPHRGQAPE